MFERFRIRRRNRAIIDALYAEVVETARAPRLYVECGIPDTVMGRFEALSVHVFLIVRRCRASVALEAIGQDLVDRFVTDVEHSIRELGVGDQAVPKRMRKLAGVFYERVAAYDPAFAAGAVDRAALTEALHGRAVPADATTTGAERLAAYMDEWSGYLASVPEEALLAGTLDREVA